MVTAVNGLSGQVDFDGDEMSANMPVDMEMAHLLEPLKPHKSAHSIIGYRKMSPNFSWPKPIVATHSANLRHKSLTHDPAPMAALAV